MAYTTEQKSEIEYLINRGKAIHKQMESATTDYDRERLQSDLDYIKSELKGAMNAESMFREHLRIAQEHLDEAEKIFQKWHRERSKEWL